MQVNATIVYFVTRNGSFKYIESLFLHRYFLHTDFKLKLLIYSYCSTEEHYNVRTVNYGRLYMIPIRLFLVKTFNPIQL